MTTTPTLPGRAIEIVLLALVMVTLIPAMIFGGVWNQVFVITIHAAFFGIVGVAVARYRKGHAP